MINNNNNNNNNNAINLTPNVDRFQTIANELSNLYRVKNNAYGNSFSTSVRSYGLIAALTRISDKFHRLENLILHPATDVGDERLTDTLKDLASYAIMTCIEVEQTENVNANRVGKSTETSIGISGPINFAETTIRN